MAWPVIMRGCLILSSALAVAALPDNKQGEAVGKDGTSQPTRRFEEVVQPFIKSYCLGCHGPAKHEAKLDLGIYASEAEVLKNLRTWDTVAERLEAEEMPPARAKLQPTAHERRAVVDWIRALLEREAARNAGDPGLVLARRLNHAEFDNTIRDLTGVDIRPTRQFPVDPANEAGFDNSGESLTMSPGLMKKYLAAGRFVADHLVLKPRGFVFAPFPVLSDTDRDKYCVQRIMAFYERHRVDYADYFFALWSYRHREALGRSHDSLADFARKADLDSTYLTTIWSLLMDPQPSSGPVEEIRTQWNKLPADAHNLKEVRRECRRLGERVISLRKALSSSAEKLRVRGMSPGSQPLVLWRNRQIAAQHQRAPAGNSDDAVALFCRVFPDEFVVLERAPYYDATTSAKGRLLSAGFHLMTGYDRDDGPLYNLILDEAGRREIDSLWDELHFVTGDSIRQFKDFIFFERAEPPRFMFDATFDFARSEDKDATSEAKMSQLREVYLARAKKNGASAQAMEAIETYFAIMSSQIRRVEQARREAESGHLAELQAFAARAYRRPLLTREREGLLEFYHELRGQEHLSHEEAIRDGLVRILLSPHFSYRLDLAGAGRGVQALSDYALANRLSYFLWSSMPDEKLLSHAAAGDLHSPNILIGQTRRMLHDARVRGLAEQFAGNWLEFARFEESNTVDRGRFPTFSNELRQAMAEEPIRFFMHVATQNRPVLDFLDADYTFVNPVLAKHYGMAIPDTDTDQWVRVDNANRYGRGGLLPMAVFLTKNSPGLRTSPVKRGYWVVRRMLGERIPPPPPEVPELPKDEAKTGERTLPQLLAQHRAHPACAGCHQRFDALGLAFEAYGPIGERRTLDLGGRPVNPQASFPDGSQGKDLDGLRHYLIEKRRDEFVDNLCRKLFAYALGRTLTLSDKATIEKMRAELGKDGFRFHSLVESIVVSPQFLNQRGRDDTRE